jgi:hypothetical protein
MIGQHVKRLCQLVLFQCVLWNTAPLVAQTAARSDTLDAMQRAREAASEPVVGGYFLAGLVSAPLTVAPLVVLTDGGRPKTWMAVGPVTLTVTLARAARSNLPLPPDVANMISGADSAYSAVFHRTYDEALRRRRRVATVVGSVTGVIGAIVLLVYGLRDYT